MNRISAVAACILAARCLFPGGAQARPVLRFPVKNIVFDIGGVLTALNIETFKARMTPIAGSFDAPAFHAAIEKFETGKLAPEQFIAALRDLNPANKALKDEEIIAAWNSQIGAADCSALEMIRALKAKGLKTYVLSTTNPLAVKLIEAGFRSCFPQEKGDVLALLFDKRYYTADLGLLKPDPAIYAKVANDGSMNPKETLFLDDSPANVIGAQQAGLFSLLVPTIGEGPRFTLWLPKLLSAQ